MPQEEGIDVDVGLLSDIADNCMTLQLPGINSSIHKSLSEFQINTEAKYNVDNSKMRANIEATYTSQVNTKLKCTPADSTVCACEKVSLY